MRILLAVVLFSIQLVKANASHIDIVEGSHVKVCQSFFRILLSEKASQIDDMVKLISDKNSSPVWHQGTLYGKPATSEYYSKESFSYSSFDIDNDGTDEFVISMYTWLSQKPGMYYRVLESPIPVDGTYKVEWPEIYKLKGLYSSTPWPYTDMGLYFVNISPFNYKGTYYLALEDTRFGQKESMDSSIVITKYSNQMIEKYKGEDIVTSSIEALCKFKYVN